MAAEKIELGVWVKEIVSGYTGVVVVVSYYISGCTHVCVESADRKKDNGNAVEQWFDIRRVRAIPKRKKVTLGPIDADKPAAKRGGPGPAPSNAHP